MARCHGRRLAPPARPSPIEGGPRAKALHRSPAPWGKSSNEASEAIDPPSPTGLRSPVDAAPDEGPRAHICVSRVDGDVDAIRCNENNVAFSMILGGRS